jgi:RibD C-terminal domain
MSKVFSALSVSVDGYITGRDPGPGRGLGDAAMLFDWYFDGDAPSRLYDGFRLSEPKDVALMGGGVVTAALNAGLVDELILHQVPILLGGGRPFFQSLTNHVRLRLVEAVPAPGVTHLHYEVARNKERTHA